MAWRGVHISQPSRLTFRDRQLVVAQDDGEVSLAIEDIAWLVLDTPQVSVSGSLLSAFAEGGIAMIVPDSKHHPAGVLLPFHQHHVQAHIAHLQIGISQPLKKRLWQALVVAKIRNQATLLAHLGRPREKTLLAMAERVGSGDPDNIEAQAARSYWPDLFSGFTRGNETDRRNALLNYGYAVIRAALARACTASGLLPAFGVHHASRSNAFNLVDDLIEPFRPFVDLAVHERAQECENKELTVEDRRFMAAILNRSAAIGPERMTILAATEAVAMSMVRAMEHNSAALLQTPGWAGED
ncbi:CRISPR-associated endonuclease Cas1 [Brucella endophytica]|uniref:CRISPR-associated endonuclease Cas1 n=1 Tax=Brucella endophytica TaxID=1963359 RepID=A0A916SN13_9HYPH|nr:type II CRISPR-associated endonuclease Cas1 [Brucella endophytica]GGB05447.1 CRISPR-associated endonuclease Cas1 [Brucella endophytica]